MAHPVQETKTGTEGDKIFRNLLYYLATVLVAVVFLSHIYLPAREPAVKVASDKISENYKSIEFHKDSIVGLASLFSIGKINKNTFNKKVVEHKMKIDEFQSLIEPLQQSYNEIQENHRVFGFPSRHKFVWNFGIGLIISVLALEILFSINDTTGARKKAKTAFGITAGAIGGYFLTWIFFPQDDLPYWSYIYIMLTIGLFASITAYYLIKIRTNSIKKLMLKIKRLFRFIYEDIEEGDFIKDERKEEYEKSVVLVTDEVHSDD